MILSEIERSLPSDIPEVQELLSEYLVDRGTHITEAPRDPVTRQNANEEEIRLAVAESRAFQLAAAEALADAGRQYPLDANNDPLPDAVYGHLGGGGAPEEVWRTPGHHRETERHREIEARLDERGEVRVQEERWTDDDDQ